MIEQYIFMTESDLAIWYVCGIALSLFLRFLVLTLSFFVYRSTRLKDVKNTTRKISQMTIRHSYLSLIWPIEIVLFVFQDLKHFLWQ